MKYLFDYGDKLRKALIDKYLLLFLDYDGTLAPIVDRPEKAIIFSETKNLLQRLIKNSRCKLAIISGRALKDIKKLVGVEGIIYAGNHGLEIEGPKIKFESLISVRLKSMLGQIKEDLTKQLSGIKGILIEDKGLTLSIHYRLVDKKEAPLLENIFTEITRPYVVRQKIRVNSGKKVYEIKPPIKWDKGKVTLWLLAREQFIMGERILPIYIGDDVTDEDAFRVLRKTGITIFVGRPNKITSAQYYLKDTKEVKKFLTQIESQRAI